MPLLSSPTPSAEIVRDDALRRSILRRIRPVVHACGTDEHEVTCQLSGDARALTVEIRGPGALRSVEQAVAVRVLDAVHAHGATFGTVRVVVRD